MRNAEIRQSLSRLAEIEALQGNWNGNGAAAFSNAIMQQARELVEGLAIQPVILPTGQDSIQMEYEKANGDYLEFELFEGGRLKMFFYMQDGTSETKDIPLSLMNKVVCAFYGRTI